MTSNVVDLDMVRAARAIADEFEAKLGSEIKKAKAHGFVLKYRLEQEEQIGRGVLNVAVVRLVPDSNRQRTRFRRMKQACIQARADYEDPTHTFDALHAAVTEAFTLANDAGVLD